MTDRLGSITRKTNETNVELKINLDGTGRAELATGVPFLTHMLDLFAKHGLFDLSLKGEGDIEIDAHHTTEDIGICLGQAFREALGTKTGIRRYGHAVIPMDEALSSVTVDLSDRPHFEWRGELTAARVGTFDTELVHEFLWKFALEARINLHVNLHYGRNTHHMIESVFKALGRALDEASLTDPRVTGIPSTKGSL